jgi:hypothetical protein
MVYVQLAHDWTDGTGAAHHAGDMVDVDAVTLAELEATGVVTPSGEWVGPTEESGGDGDWVGPTEETGGDWVGPTDGGEDWVGPTDGGV